jgi:drug/metabolite transporter (DMT)-like permease
MLASTGVSVCRMTRPEHSPLWPGVPMALGAAVLFGAAAPFAKLLLGAVEPQMLAGLLYLGAGIGLAAVHFGVAPSASRRRRRRCGRPICPGSRRLCSSAVCSDRFCSCSV